MKICKDVSVPDCRVAAVAAPILAVIGFATMVIGFSTASAEALRAFLPF